jgi:hypothetical protein
MVAAWYSCAEALAMSYVLTESLVGLIAEVQGSFVAGDAMELRDAGVARVVLAMPTWDGSGLENLSYIQGLNALRIHAYSALDIGRLPPIPGLMELFLLGVPAGSLNLKGFPKLRAFGVFLQAGNKLKIEGLVNAVSLEVLQGNLPSKNVPELSSLNSLALLSLRGEKLETLDFIRNLKNLRGIALERCSQLRELEAVADLPNIEFLKILGSRRVGDIEPLRHSPPLKYLSLDDCGDIPSITGLSSLRVLTLSGDTSIEDGRVAWLRNMHSLRHCWFVNRDGYDCLSSDLPFDLEFAATENRKYQPAIA